MNDRTLIIAALVVGGAIVTASLPARTRYALSAVNNNVAWRMDTWSGQVDICAAAYLKSGPLVRCGATVVVPAQPDANPQPQQPPADTPPQLPQGAPL